MAWLGLIATVIWNYANHRRGKPTICAVTRRVLPARGVVAALAVGAAALTFHLVNGYPKERD